MSRRSLVEFFEQFRRQGAEIAYVQRRGYRTARWTYQQVAETAAQFARELEARQIGPGDRVVLWGENCAEWVAAFFGCVLRGAVVVPMDAIATSDFVQRVASQVEAKLLVAARERAKLAPALPTITLETLAEAVAGRSPAPYRSPELRREDTAQIVFTSGTTAVPKGVVISHGNLLANLEPLEPEIKKYRKYERLFHPIRFMNLVPLSHVFGQFLGLFLPPLLGGTVIFSDTLSPAEILRTIQRERVSVLVAVPRLLDSLKDKVLRDLEAAGQQERFQQQFQAAAGEQVLKRWWRFRQVRGWFGWKFWALISGGAALSAETETFWKRLGYLVIQGYGLTETAALVSVNHPVRVKKGSIGLVVPGRELKLAEDGEILVRGESIAVGYWQELEPVRDHDGWFHTGDLGALDDKGNLYFKGRKKEVIVTPEGMNIHPEDLEAALRRQPEVRDCAVIGLTRDGNAEPCAVLLLRDIASDPESVIQRANQSLAAYQQIRRWFVWPEDDFPRTATLKPRLRLIQEVVQARRERAALPVPSGSLAELIAQVTRRTPPALRPEANLETDLNLSSIDRVELLSALEDRYQIDLNETRFAAATTVGELEEMLRQPRPRRTDYTYPRWPQRWPLAAVRGAAYYLLIWPATLLLAYPRIRGREHLRAERGPLLFVCNHITRADIAFVLAALPARFRHRLAVAMEGERLRRLRHPPAELAFPLRCLERIKYVLVAALFNVFPLPIQTGFRESFAFAGESVDRGLSVLVFPEGELTKDGRLGRFRAGMGILANKLDLPLVPLRIDGLFELKQAGKRWARPGAVKVTIGSPVRFEPDADPAAITRELERRVASLG